jgi:ABC-type multidrug transport system ATPase subunit
VSDTVVEIHGLSKRYGNGVLAVEGLDLHLRRGEVYGFLGPNGAGKTTTLRMLVGLIRPTSGTARVFGLAPGSEAGLARLGCLVESPAFYPYLSGRDNLRLLARYCRVPWSRVEEVLDKVGLITSAQQKFATYSLGMKQRLGVGAALLKDPDLLLLDEPASGLDPEGIAGMRELIRDAAKSGRTVLFSSHQLSEVEHVCHRAGIIQHGRLVAEGRLDDLLGAPALLVRAEPLDEAQMLLEEMLGSRAVQQRDGAFYLAIDPSRGGEVSTRLALAGIIIKELRSEDRSLEDVFLQLTKRT